MLPTPCARDHKGRTDPEARGRTPGRGQLPDAVEKLLPTPVSSDARGGRNSTDRESTGRTTGNSGDTLTDAMWKLDGPLLPTPNPFHSGNEEAPDDWRARRLDVYERTGTRHGPALGVIARSIAAGDPLTPDRYMPDQADDPEEVVEDGGLFALDDVPALVDDPGQWGPYAPAVLRWETVRGIPAPDPVEPNRNGNPRLAPAFVEWMMGLPPGHVTAVPGIGRSGQLTALGNGVVPQQATEAFRRMVAASPRLADAVARLYAG